MLKLTKREIFKLNKNLKIDQLINDIADGFESREEAQAYLAERVASQNQLKVQGTVKENGFKLNRDV